MKKLVSMSAAVLTLMMAAPICAQAQTSCQDAQEIQLDEAVSTPAPGTDYWYSVELVAGTSYVVEWTSGGGDFYFYDACGGSQVGGGSQGYTPSTGGTYYMYGDSYNGGSSFRVVEVADNRVCANAYTLAPGQDTAPPTTYTTYWYKVYLEEGSSYIAETSGGSVSINYYNACGSDITSVAPVATSDYYYVRAYSSSAGARFKLTAVTDNRSCAYPQALALGQDTAPPTGNYYWYKVSLEAGKSYVTERTGSIDAYFYNACGGNQVEVATAAADVEYYVRARSYSEGSTFKVVQITDNRACAYAQTLRTGLDTAAPPQSGTYYYKVSLEAGKSYEVLWTSGNGSASVRKTCASSSNVSINPAQEGGEYYIRAESYSTVGRFQVKQITDNRLCTYAQIIVADRDTAAPPQSYAYYWYKVNLQAGKSYEAKWTSGSGYFYIYKTCTGGSSVSINPAVAGGDYYIQAYAYGTSKFVVEEIRDNRACVNAQAIPLNSDTATPTPNTYYWYRVTLEAGKPYIVEWTGSSGDAYFYTACNSSTSAQGTLAYTAAAAGTYYLRVYAYSGSRFRVVKLAETDNRACIYAQAIPLNSDTATPTPNTYYWYRVTLTAGRSYASEWTGSGNAYAFNSCTGNEVSVNPAAASGTYYIRVNASSGSRFRIADINDNRSCANALTIAANQDTATPSIRVDYWYRVSLTAGKSYELQWTGSNGSNSGSGYFYTSCGGNASRIYAPAATGAYYVQAYANYQDSRFKVVEVTDNRACTNATDIDIDEEVTPPTPNTYYWYKVTLTAGKSYITEWTNANNGWGYFYTACGGSEVSVNPAAASGEYYIRATSYQTGNSFKVTEVSDHRVCTNAPSITLGAAVSVPVSSSSYWYRVTLTAGKAYKTEVTGSGSYPSITTACGGTGVAGVNNVYLINTGGVYYIDTRAIEEGYTFTITETALPDNTDNRFCNYAQPINLGAAVTPAERYWYTVPLTAGKSYEVQWTGSNNYGFTYMFNACGGAQVSDANADGKTYYTIATSGTYYIQGYSYETGNSFKISEVTAPVVLGVSVAPWGVSVQKGRTQQFTASVNVQGGAAQTVTWSVAGGGAGTSISASGLLTVAAGEAASVLIVTATSTANNTKYGTAQVTVTADAPPALVLSVSVTPQGASVGKGGNKQFAANVSVQGNVPQTTVTWSVTGVGGASLSAGTSISTGGLLSVAANEAATAVIVRATSNADTTKSGSVQVTIAAADPTDPTDPNNPNAVEAEALPKLAVYPNPVGDVLYITDAFVGNVEIYSITGALVLVTDRASINIARLPAGIYVVKAGGRAAKVVKQ